MLGHPHDAGRVDAVGGCGTGKESQSAGQRGPNAHTSRQMHHSPTTNRLACGNCDKRMYFEVAANSASTLTHSERRSMEANSLRSMLKDDWVT